MTTEHAPKDGNWFVQWLKRKWLAIILVVLIVIVAVQNGLATEKAHVQVLWAEWSMPTWLLVAILFVVGGIVGWLLARNRAARKARR